MVPARSEVYTRRVPAAEILTIGDELLSGETVDTNSNWLDGALVKLGWEVTRHTTVADEVAVIAAAFDEAARRSDLVISSGGLGPTRDDLTLEALAKALGCELRLDEAVLADIRAKFESFGRTMSPNNERQARVPAIGEVLQNAVGTAPGFTAELHGAQVFLLPGVPREVKWLMEHRVGPRVDQGRAHVARRTLKTIGFGESRLEHTIKATIREHPDVQFGFRALGAETHIKMAARGEQREAHLAAAEAAMRAILGVGLFGADDDRLVVALGDLLRARGETVATAESCTGGMVGKLLTDVSGSSAYFLGGMITYSNAAKVALLGVDEGALEEHGAVSAAVAEQMAVGVRDRLGATWGLSATGIAGPEGGTTEKPVGLVYIGLAGPGHVEHRRLQSPGDRSQVRRNSALSVVDILRRRLVAEKPGD